MLILVLVLVQSLLTSLLAVLSMSTHILQSVSQRHAHTDTLNTATTTYVLELSADTHWRPNSNSDL